MSKLAEKDLAARLAAKYKENPSHGGWDKGAADLGWTVQLGQAKPDTEDNRPGAVILESELPDPAVQLAASIEPALSNVGLVVVKTEKERAKIRGSK